MAQIQVTFNGSQTDLDDFCTQHHYQEILDDGKPNPETKAQFFTRTVKDFVWGSVLAQRVTTATNAARDIEIAKTINF